MAANTTLIKIDPDGDTLLILHNPNAPFAVFQAGSMWPNVLPQHQSGLSRHHEEEMASSTSESTVDKTKSMAFETSDLNETSSPSTSNTLQSITKFDHTSLPSEHNTAELQIQVSSKALMLASTYFKRMMSTSWKEANSGLDYSYTMQTTDWDDEALCILMNIIHHRNSKVPRKLSLMMLTKMAVLVDYYGCHEAVELWAEGWIRNLDKGLAVYYSRHLILRLTVAWVFSESDTFNRLAKAILERSRGRLHTLGLPIPGTVVDALEKKRQEAIYGMVSKLHNLMDKLYKGKESCSSFECSSLLLGSLAKNMYENALQPRPEPPFNGYSVTALIKAFSEFTHPRRFSISGQKPHGCSLKEKINQYAMECSEFCEIGLDLRCFDPSELARKPT